MTPAIAADANSNVSASRDTLADTRVDVARRREAAIALLTMGQPGISQLSNELSPSADPETHLLIVRAIILSESPPPQALAQPMLELLPDADPLLLPELAAALGRYTDPGVLAALIAPGQNTKLPPEGRRAAVFALGFHRRIDVARVLMDRIQPSEPPIVRRAGFEALANLSGIDTYGYDLGRWRQWWDKHRRLTDAQWAASLLEYHARRNAVAALQVQRIEDRLPEVYRPLYRATPAADRPSLLASMLTDPLENIRLLAIELTLQWLTDSPVADDQPIHAGLKTALLSRLDDTSPTVRQGAARLLRELRDDTAANAVEKKLIEGQEHDTEVLKAYLQVMARMPRRGAVEVMIQMLADPLLRNDAAGALAEAVSNGGLTPEVTTSLTRQLEALTRGDQPPEPRVIDLIGRLGGMGNWRTMASWMDASSQDVREAAAKAWAASSQPLSELASRSDDPIIQRVFVEAAGRRGDTVEDFDALVELRPGDGGQLASWQRSVAAMASRVPASAVLAADARLQNDNEDQATRDRILSAAIEANDSVPGGRNTTREVAMLLLARGELRLSQGDVNQALTDLTAIDSGALSDPAMKQRHNQALFRTRLASGDIEPAFSLASEIFNDSQTDEAARNGVIEELLAAVQRQIATGQLESARNILARLRVLLGNHQPSNSTHTARITEFESKAGTTPTPIAPPTDKAAPPRPAPPEEPQTP